MVLPYVILAVYWFCWDKFDQVSSHLLHCFTGTYLRLYKIHLVAGQIEKLCKAWLPFRVLGSFFELLLLSRA